MPKTNFYIEFEEIRAETATSYIDIPPLDECIPYSPGAYDPILVSIIKSLPDCI